jgi:hypothetical protein
LRRFGSSGSNVQRLTAFGVGFVFVRMVLGSLPDRMSGYRVAMWSL